ncbi:hypothetical protein [Azospirillum sp. B4]|uniref:hypothetical protein n=1 Tax=Azospirillum sp. B4 TaxID=95605 RepID=UPI00034C9107|nr:hypothetical protein [Azospirillum sp. B4]
MRNHLILAAAFGLVLATTGCQTTPDNGQTATKAAAAQPDNKAAQKNCVTTGSRLGGTCYAGGQADKRDLLNHPQDLRSPH